MLAGPKKKQKWSSDPQNTAWANDESRFGRKMMEKMGWAKGKGLGANEDGKVDPVKIQKKNDNRGVGCSHSHENNWVAHQDDFSSLLLQLNNHTSSNASDERTNISVSCMEEKSKVQKRVHYKKFTKGKDLSSYKAADMAAIFGSRISHSLPTTPLNLSDVDDSSDTESCPESIEKVKFKSRKKAKVAKNTELSNVITSKLSITEYFKMKMETVESKRICESKDFTTDLKNQEVKEVISNCNNLKKKKKRPKKEQSSNDEKCNSLLSSIDNMTEDIATLDNVKSVLGTRKRKKSHNSNNKRSKIRTDEDSC